MDNQEQIPSVAHADGEDLSSSSLELMRIAQRGIQLCREGMWKKGLGYLAAVAEAKARGLDLPGRFYSYLGYGIANFENRLKEGLDLCKHAVEIEFYQPENYVNLANVYLLMNARRMAIRSIEQGLRVDPENRELRELRREVGKRMSPVIPFLSRGHAINHALGRMRYSLLRLGADS